MEKLEKLLISVIKEEDRYYELANKALHEGNMIGNQVCVAQASAFQRVRYAIEDMLQNSII